MQVYIYVFNNKRYHDEILPAIHSFVNGGGVDQLIALLKQAHSESLDVSGFEYAPREDYLLEIRILENFAASGAKSLDTHVPWGRKTRSIRSIVVSTIASDLV